MNYGKFHIYTGNGKGKTTSAIGQAIRCAGTGRKVYFVQFLKAQPTGEQKILTKIPNISFKKFGITEFIINNNLKKEHFIQIEKGIIYLDNILKNKKIDLLVLDEFNLVLYYNLIKLDKFKEIIKICKNKKIELIITGRHLNEEISNLADLVTEMKEIKHYFKETLARKGIEY